jgi:hypothetical protein
MAIIGTPAIYWTYRSADLDDAHRLEHRGFVACGGDGSRFSEANARHGLAQTVLSPALCGRTSDQGVRLPRSSDGHTGASRIVQLLVALRAGASPAWVGV